MGLDSDFNLFDFYDNLKTLRRGLKASSFKNLEALKSLWGLKSNYSDYKIGLFM